MRRYLIVLLLIFMPLQSAWSAVSWYCTHHERGAAAAHWGHHSDGHEEEAVVQNSAGNGNWGPTLSVDGHAHAHHHGGTLAMVSVIPELSLIAVGGGIFHSARVHYPEPVAARIDRPQWPGLA